MTRTLGVSLLIAAALLGTTPSPRAALAAAPGADLSVKLKASPKKLKLGGRVVFKVEVENHGREAATDVLYGFEGFPDPVSMQSLDCGGGTPASIGSALCHLDTIAPGARIKVVVEALITNLLPGQRRVTVSASARTATPDTNPENDVHSVTVTVTGGPPVDGIDPDRGSTDAASD